MMDPCSHEEASKYLDLSDSDETSPPSSFDEKSPLLYSSTSSVESDFVSYAYSKLPSTHYWCCIPIKDDSCTGTCCGFFHVKRLDKSQLQPSPELKHRLWRCLRTIDISSAICFASSSIPFSLWTGIGAAAWICNYFPYPGRSGGDTTLMLVWMAAELALSFGIATSCFHPATRACCSTTDPSDLLIVQVDPNELDDDSLTSSSNTSISGSLTQAENAV